MMILFAMDKIIPDRAYSFLSHISAQIDLDPDPDTKSANIDLALPIDER